jgi:hypothetical protein
MAAGFMAGFGTTMSKLIEEDREYYRELATKKRDYLQTYGTKAVLDRDEKANGALSVFNTLVTAGIPEEDLRYVLDTTGVPGLAQLSSTLSSRSDLTKSEIAGLVKKSKDYVAENPDEDISTVLRRAYGLYKSADNPVDTETNLFSAVLGLDSRMMEREALNDVYIDGFKGTDLYAIMARGGPKPGEALSLNLPTKPPSTAEIRMGYESLQDRFVQTIDAKIKALTQSQSESNTDVEAARIVDNIKALNDLKGRGVLGYAKLGEIDPTFMEYAKGLEETRPGIITRNPTMIEFGSAYTSYWGDKEDDAKLDSAPNGGETPSGPTPKDETPKALTPSELRVSLTNGELTAGTKVVVNGKEVVITQEQINNSNVKAPGMTTGEGLSLEKDGSSLLPPVEEETSSTSLPDRSAMEAKLQQWMSYLTTPSAEAPVTTPSAEAPVDSSDAAVIEEALTRSDAIDDKLAMQRRETALNDFDLPVPPEDLSLIDTLSVNTEADLKAAITKRIGEMPPDYKVQVADTLASLNEVLKAFETSANISIENAIDAVTVDNIDEAVNNMAVRMFDTIADYDYETLEERIINQNEVPSASANRAAALSGNRAAAFAKLQQQFSELAFFPKGVPGEIDLGPTMGEVSSDWLHSTQDNINSAIASAAKSFLAKIGIGKPSADSEFNESVKAEKQPEPLVTRPKRTEQPKEMTASDKARLQRAQKANELSGDSGLLEMLVEKYGIALVQKEMGL